MKRITTLFTFLLLMLVTVASAIAGKLSIQGHLANGGVSMDGSHPATFSFYDAPTAGTLLWTESDTILVSSYLFSATLGKNVSIPTAVFAGPEVWLETSIDGTTLTPRVAYYPQPTTGGTDNLWSTDGTSVSTQHNIVAGPKADGWSYQASVEGSGGKMNLYTDPQGAGYITTTTLNKPLYLYGDVAVSDASNNRNIRLNRDGSSMFSNRAQLSNGLRLGSDNAEVNGAPYYGLGMSNLQLPNGSGYPAVQLGGYYGLNLQSAGGSLTIQADGTVRSTGALCVANGQGLNVRVSGNNGDLPVISMNSVDNTTVAAGNTIYFSLVNGGASMSLDHNTGLTVNGNFTASGTKCREVDSPKYGKLYFNAVESGEAIFTTSGREHLIHGKARINLNPKWLAGVTVDNDHVLDVTSVVFYGPHGDWYAIPDHTGFDIIDPTGCNSEFFWTAQARQKGYESRYLDNGDATTAVHR